MEIVVKIVQQIPPTAPRVTAVVALVLVFFLPEVRRLLHKLVIGDSTEQLKSLLEVRKLELEVAALKAARPEAAASPIDAEIEELRKHPDEGQEEGEPLMWPVRLQFALAGAFSGVVISSLALWVVGQFKPLEASHVLLKECVVALIGGFLASAIPSRVQWHCAFRGLLIPAIVAALGVLARVR